MIFRFFNGAYFIGLGASLLVVAMLYLLLFRTSMATKKLSLLILMLLNVGQHLCKGILYPHLYGTGFGMQNTAYNYCAFMILLSPVVFLVGNKAWKDYVCLAGTVGSLTALLLPFWFRGQPFFQWEALRFYICHVLMLATSVLPLLLRVHRVTYKNFWKIPFQFFLSLCVILLNQILCVCAGFTAGGTGRMYEALLESNPLWMMGPAPAEGFEWVETAICALSPSFLLGGNGRPYIPILWYAIPVFAVLMLVSFTICTLCDLKRFRADLSARRRARRLLQR